MGATSRERITKPDKFVNIFNYEAFYNHLTQTFRNHFFPRIKAVQPEATETVRQREARLAQIYKDAPAGLKQVIDEFNPPYALVREACIILPGVRYCEIDGLYPNYWSISGSVFLDEYTSGYGTVPLDTEEGPITDGWMTYDYPFSKENPFNRVRMRSYDKMGNEQWYLKIDRSLLSNALPSVVIGGFDALKDFEWGNMKVQTDMTQKEWAKYSANDFSLPDLLSMNIDDPALSSKLKERIQEQVNHDAQMWGITRWIKHSWNSWELRDVGNWLKSLIQ